MLQLCRGGWRGGQGHKVQARVRFPLRLLQRDLQAGLGISPAQPTEAPPAPGRGAWTAAPSEGAGGALPPAGAAYEAPCCSDQAPSASLLSLTARLVPLLSGLGMTLLVRQLLQQRQGAGVTAAKPLPKLAAGSAAGTCHPAGAVYKTAVAGAAALALALASIVVEIPQPTEPHERPQAAASPASGGLHPGWLRGPYSV